MTILVMSHFLMHWRMLFFLQSPSSFGLQWRLESGESRRAISGWAKIKSTKIDPNTRRTLLYSSHCLSPAWTSTVEVICVQCVPLGTLELVFNASSFFPLSPFPFLVSFFNVFHFLVVCCLLVASKVGKTHVASAKKTIKKWTRLDSTQLACCLFLLFLLFLLCARRTLLDLTLGLVFHFSPFSSYS